MARKHAPLAGGVAQQRRLAEVPLARTFAESLRQSGLFPLGATGVRILQINTGKRCNQTCKHCHVDAGPDRTEVMSREVMDACLAFLERAHIPTLDITGGAPELHPHFREIVERGAATGAHVIHRCNLTAILLPNYADIPALLARHRVEVCASLPYFQARETDAQRGDGVFEQSIEGLRRLNALGYGGGDGLLLNLVTNPVGTFLPGNQRELEVYWKKQLSEKFGIVFDNLYTITNLPISRFLEFLEERGRTEEYLTRLVDAYNPAAAEGVMCRTTLSVGWDGTLYDCDFNQMLELPVAGNAPRHIRDFDPERLNGREIVTANHCYGCTAGAGSSCGGAVA
jgi:radical SAM/Cys-rich protein